MKITDFRDDQSDISAETKSLVRGWSRGGVARLATAEANIVVGGRVFDIAGGPPNM